MANIASGVTMLLDATGEATSATVQVQEPSRTFQVVLTGPGTYAGVDILVSNVDDDEHYLILSTIEVTAEGQPSNGLAINAPWRFVRARVRHLSGGAGRVRVLLGV